MGKPSLEKGDDEVGEVMDDEMCVDLPG